MRAEPTRRTSEKKETSSSVSHLLCVVYSVSFFIIFFLLHSVNVYVTLVNGGRLMARFLPSSSLRRPDISHWT